MLKFNLFDYDVLIFAVFIRVTDSEIILAHSGPINLVGLVNFQQDSELCIVEE